MEKCIKHGCELECFGGLSAHPDNWTCPQCDEENSKQPVYSCNVLNCGNGACIHKLLDECCPHCGNRLVLVTTTGFKFCSNIPKGPLGCDYEVEVA